ncbi:MAG: cation diffusion facilitator family transporter [Candidatus Eisenbacteria bacterium]
MLVVDRRSLLDRAWALALATLGWTMVEAVAALGFGAAARSTALLGFGADSVIEFASGLLAAWRIARERGGDLDPIAAERLERRTGRIAGALLLVVGGWIVWDAIERLTARAAPPGESPGGIVLAAASAVAMPLLGRAKRRVADALESPTLRADAVETIACGWLAAATLIGLVLHAWFGWWWADPVAGLALVPLLAREGLEGLRGETDEGPAPPAPPPPPPPPARTEPTDPEGTSPGRE